MSDTYHLARLTHNTKNWTKPSGPEHKSGNTNSRNPAFEAVQDFGFEEWLLDERHRIDNYQYGYVESIQAKHQNNLLLLYTFRYRANRRGRADRLAVGVIKKWEHIDNWASEELSDVLSIWHQQMIDDLRALKNFPKLNEGIKQIKLHAAYPDYRKPLFNIRFYIEDICVFKNELNAREFARANFFVIGTVDHDSLPGEVQRAITSVDCKPIQ